MKTIYKYRIPFMEKAIVSMPAESKVIRVAGVDGSLWLWAVVDTDKPMVDREFSLFKTGSEMPEDIDGYRYLGWGAIYVQMELAMYVFENLTYTHRPSIPVTNDFNWKNYLEARDGAVS